MSPSTRPHMVILLQLIFVYFFTFTSANEASSGTFRHTFSDEELDLFCATRHAAFEGTKIHGYIHPFYCSRYIECAKVKGEDGKEVIKSEEKICPRCPSSKMEGRAMHNAKSIKRAPANKLCKFGHLHFDELLQNCHPQKGNCIQSELPKNNIWGSKEFAPLCEEVPIGTTQTFPDPYHCGKYIKCHRDMDYFRDLWIDVEPCPSCDTSTPGCTDGYMYYSPPFNGTDSFCHLTNTLPPDIPVCNPATRKAYTSLSSSTPSPPPALDVVDVLPKSNQVEAATTFCSGHPAVTKRYPVADKCNSYFFCYADLYDRDGDMRPLAKVHHFLFNCDSCSDVHADSENCNATTDGTSNNLAFSFEQQSCVVPSNGTCLHDGSFRLNEVEIKREQTEQAKAAKIMSWKVPLMTKDEVLAFCKEKGTTGNFKHPKDPICSRYVECWEKMNIFREKACPPCHHSFSGHVEKCPNGHLYFNPGSGTCDPGQNSSICNPEPPPPTPDPSLPQSITTPSPSAEPDEEDTPIDEANEEETETELMTPKECNLKNYVQRGYCKTYFTCDRKTRMEKQHECSGRLYWNPEANPIHGGVCDYLRNIDNFTLYQYKKDPGCPLNLAYFRLDEVECSGTYFYHHPTRTNGKEVKLTCPEDLVWTKEAKTCTKCHQILKLDGVTPCCPLPEGNEGEDVDAR